MFIHVTQLEYETFCYQVDIFHAARLSVHYCHYHKLVSKVVPTHAMKVHGGVEA
jgi:hypothetical protein